ncbi:hypothetical protein EDB85DRAFT_2150954 [Lactarius pseudohatsudake]|nr:hypothetical protein EDB85DRAFT_2150954 [Lactarius pseudohatsudake]
MDEDAPQKRATRSTAAGNKQKGKKGPGQQAKPASATHTPPVNGSPSQGVAEEDENDIMAQMEKVKAGLEELKALKAQKEALTKEITEASTVVAASLPKIERPRSGTNIQDGMRLSDDKPRYHAIRRLVMDLVAAAGINWEVRWADIPASKKAKLYQAAREQAPYLKRFSNDWATEALAKQLLKNKRGHSYRSGYLEVPAKYAYLKDNAAKRRPRGCRGALATPALQLDSDDEGGTNGSHESADTSAVATGSKSKCAASVTVATQQPRKKQKSNTGTATTAKTRFSLRASEKQRAASQEFEVEGRAGESDEDGEASDDNDTE